MVEFKEDIKIIEEKQKEGITIPDSYLKRFGLSGGKIMVLGIPGGITLRKIYSAPEETIKRTIDNIRAIAKEKKITKAAVERAIKAVRKTK
ncbi:hypothetical protein A2276_08540 [candidate division WOR-1 bacterium RIFOXYA12_FULL_43_27]|uniref:SpoVT-AbrB domain-containing protein n=1 Tax=candidate division WOR-1 bacterium RIFOXYC2_FULL_46_14 TaxID=1802587 RepID=A0A1F4U6M8_UNCSA|nr:MAG: hypothetical protein A2276_08540 [candidate division WOR-1 bacterium RIFOXYA12_FULL_43_27]OGC20639.1 MAG: hypothetical protein A2292_06365 [candidate division WOR-1 bacterium RIFOXYB2_FULL_46_45]OGC31624.1 MAG: hypothetical protein A2232_05085 [candidate division WOR-1 bacterium RIFOXYA2_FULL_46_56]OGC40480.1 MAG: hypothetical protein A2438_04395 [candidate division WOR-1 bacterium RIFOXYC2_FULL_46_14]